MFIRKLARMPVWGFVATAALALAGCGGGGGGGGSGTTPPPPAPTLSSIAVTPTTATVAIGATQQLTVTGTYSDSSTQNLTAGSTYASSASTTVASVSPSGVVTAIGAGSATITASNGGKSSTMTVTVPAPPVTLTKITVTPATVMLAAGATQQLMVTGSYSDGSTKDLTNSASYVSSAPAVATVSASGGLVAAVATGTATITASDGGQNATATVTVPAPVVTLTSIAVTPATIPLSVNGTQQLTVTGTYSDASTKNLTSTSSFAVSASSAAGVATVSAAGLVTAGTVGGTATITATNSGKTASASVTVTKPALVSIAVTPASVSLNIGATQQLSVKGTYSDGSTASLTSGETFASSNPAAASVTASGGLVSALSFASGAAPNFAPAPVTITVTDTASGKTATATITVTAPSNSGYVFLNGLPTGVSLVDSSSPAVNPTIDTTTTHNGHASIKVVIPLSGASIALVDSTAQNLTGFNAVTFWAQASVAPGAGLGVAGIGANSADQFNAEVSGFPVPAGTWQQFTIPMPDPAMATSITGLFHLGEGASAYTLWISDIQYVSTTVTPTFGGVSLPIAPATLSVGGAPNSEPIGEAQFVPFSAPALPYGGETAAGVGWFTFQSSTPGIVAISTATGTGSITAIAQGSTFVQGLLQNMPVPSGATITVGP